VSPRQIAAFAIGPIGGALLGLISLPIITWFFAQEDVGRMAMLQVTIGFSTMLFGLGLDQAYVREFHEVDDKPALLKHAALPGLLLLIATLSMLLSLGDQLAVWLFGVHDLYLTLLIVAAVLAAFTSRFLSLVLRMNERGLAFSMSQLLPKLLFLGIIGSYLLVDAEKSLKNLVFANTSALVLVCVAFAFNTRHEWMGAFGSKLSFDRLKGMLRFGAPWIIGGMAFWGLTAIDKVFLRYLSDFEELGVYSVSVSFAAAATIVQSVFSTVWAPTVYKWVSKNEGLEYIYKVNRYVLAVVVIMFCLTGLFSWLIVYFLPKEYEAVKWIVVSCMGYPLLFALSETTVVGIGISRRSEYATLAAILAFCVNIIGNWFLIPIYGAGGAAVSTCVAFWIFFIFRTEFSVYLWRAMPRVLMYIYSSVVVFFASIFTLWGDQMGAYDTVIWFVILSSAIYFFRYEIKSSFRFLISKV